MFTQDQLKKIQELLPDDWGNLISNTSGISKTTIYKYFRGENVRSYYRNQILRTAFELIEKEQESIQSNQEKYEMILENKS